MTTMRRAEQLVGKQRTLRRRHRKQGEGTKKKTIQLSGYKMSKVVRNHKNRYMLIRTRNLNNANIITQEGQRIRHRALIKKITGQGGLRTADAKGQQKACRRHVYGGGPDLPSNSTTTGLFREEGQLNMTQMDE